MSLLTVIAVHGIWDQPLPPGREKRLSYSGDFARNVVAELTRLGVVPPGADAATIAEIVRFEEVVYADIGEAEARAVYERYRRAVKAQGPLDRALDLLGVDRLRRFVIDGASDVLLYESDRYREEIRDRLRERVVAAIGAGDGAVTLVGHSLGSVVCYDVAYYDTWHNPLWRRHGFAPANLFTLGSPLALFALGYDDRGAPKPKYVDAEAVKVLVRPGGRWLNLFDAQDVIGYPLAGQFPGLVEDVIVRAGILPTTAHTRLWHNREVARRLARCLRDDYRRVTVGRGP